MGNHASGKRKGLWASTINREQDPWEREPSMKEKMGEELRQLCEKATDTNKSFFELVDEVFPEPSSQKPCCGRWCAGEC